MLLLCPADFGKQCRPVAKSAAPCKITCYKLKPRVAAEGGHTHRKIKPFAGVISVEPIAKPIGKGVYAQRVTFIKFKMKHHIPGGAAIGICGGGDKVFAESFACRKDFFTAVGAKALPARKFIFAAYTPLGEKSCHRPSGAIENVFRHKITSAGLMG